MSVLTLWVYGKVKQEEVGEQGGDVHCEEEWMGMWERNEAGTGLWDSPGGCGVGMVGTTVAWLFVLEKPLSCGSVWSISPKPCGSGQDRWLPLPLSRVSAPSPRV